MEHTTKELLNLLHEANFEKAYELLLDDNYHFPSQDVHLFIRVLISEAVFLKRRVSELEMRTMQVIVRNKLDV